MLKIVKINVFRDKLLYFSTSGEVEQYKHSVFSVPKEIFHRRVIIDYGYTR